MLTLEDLRDYYKKDYIHLRLDFHPTYWSPKGKKLRNWNWLCPEGLSGDQINQIFTEKKLSIALKRETIVFDKKFTMETEQVGVVFDITKEGSLAVSIEKGRVERGQWEKIKKQMREAGFSYRSESPWFGVFENGKWKLGPY